MNYSKNKHRPLPKQAKRKPASKPGLHPGKYLLVLGLLAIVSGAGGASLAMLMASAPLSTAASSSPHLPQSSNQPLTQIPATLSRPINVLILGIDNSGHPGAEPLSKKEALAGNSDTMLLVRLEPQTNQTTVLSIPRDTLVQFPETGIDKINAANGLGGTVLAAQTVSQLLNGVVIDRYLRVDTEGLIQLVNALGGVEVTIPKKMDYIDKTQKLAIHFAPGRQVLNGQHLQEYVRFRHDELGDIGRVQRQQEVLKALLHTFLQPNTLSKVPQVLQVARQNVDTDLSIEEMLAVSQFLIHMDRQKLNMVMLPGRFSQENEYPASYWISDAQATSTILARYFNVGTDQGVQANAPAIDPSQIRVAVESAILQPELVESTIVFLKRQGFKDVYLSDQEVIDSVDANETQIVAQHGNPEDANLVKRLLGLGQVQVSSIGDLSSDVTLVVGNDFRQRLGR